jgi:hypothetical protein
MNACAAAASPTSVPNGQPPAIAAHNPGLDNANKKPEFPTPDCVIGKKIPLDGLRAAENVFVPE